MPTPCPKPAPLTIQCLAAVAVVGEASRQQRAAGRMIRSPRGIVGGITAAPAGSCGGTRLWVRDAFQEEDDGDRDDSGNGSQALRRRRVDGDRRVVGGKR